MSRAEQDWKAEQIWEEKRRKWREEQEKEEGKKRRLKEGAGQIDDLDTRSVKITCLFQNEFFILNEQLHMVVSRQRHILTFNFATNSTSVFLPTQLVDKIEDDIEIETTVSFKVKGK